MRPTRGKKNRSDGTPTDANPTLRSLLQWLKDFGQSIKRGRKKHFEAALTRAAMALAVYKANMAKKVA